MVESVFIVTAVVGATELIKRIKIKDYFTAIIIVVAVAIGVLAYILKLGGIVSLEEGIITALSATGLYTVAAQVGSKNPVVPGKIK